MTPAETYAQSRIEAESLIRQHAPTRLQDATIERLLPAIALAAQRADDDAIAVGASKFGGAPDVPAGFAWPSWDERPLSFMAQINLEEIAPFDIENKLSASGLLLFFYFMADEDEWPWGEPDQAGGWRVMHVEGELSRAQVPDGTDNESALKTAVITPRAVWSAPKHPYYINGEQWNDWPDADFDAWLEMNRKFETGATHLMLSHPYNIQDDARMEVASTLKRGTMNDWHLLLQMNSDDEIDWMWGDAGAMFYLMHRDDLQARAWDKCWLIAQCS